MPIETFEERKRRYIESAESEINSPEQSWWEYPGPAYYRTDEYATRFPQVVDTNEPAVFRPAKKQWMIAGVVVIVAGILLYIIGKKSFGFGQALLLAVILLIVLPSLLGNQPPMIVNRNGIWLTEEQTVSWRNIVLTQIKEVHGESPVYFLIIHHYTEQDDQFGKIEVPLEGLASPATVAAAVEQFSQDGQNETSVETEV